MLFMSMKIHMCAQDIFFPRLRTCSKTESIIQKENKKPLINVILDLQPNVPCGGLGVERRGLRASRGKKKS